MRLLVTFSIFLCSLFVRDRVLGNAGANKWMTTCTTGYANTSEKAIAALQINLSFDQISLFDDDDDDDEFGAARKKFHLLRSFDNIADLLLIKGFNGDIFNPGFASNAWFLPGAEKCIFQRVLRV